MALGSHGSRTLNIEWWLELHGGPRQEVSTVISFLSVAVIAMVRLVVYKWLAIGVVRELHTATHIYISVIRHKH